jgi:YidC/Oxa1 family membrane protein insertase
MRDRAIVLAETPRVAIETPRLKGSINLKGARIDDLELSDYAETVKKGSPRIRLLSPDGAAGSYFAQVPKARIAEAVAEAVSVEASASLAKLKKGEAVAKAEALLAGTRWLPAPLRKR